MAKSSVVGIMKGVIELNWKILVGMIAAVISIVLVLLIVFGVVRADTLGMMAKDLCNAIVGRLLNKPDVDVCDIFYKG